MKKPALCSAALVVATFSLLSCGGGPKVAKPPSGITNRVFASQSVSSAVAAPGLVIIDGSVDLQARAAAISAGSSPGLMAMSPNRTIALAFDSVSNQVNVVNTDKESLTGAIPLPGATRSMVALDTGFGYAAVPSAPFVAGPAPGALIVMNLTAGGLVSTISVPNAQTVVASPDGTELLVFNGSNNVTVVYPLLVNTGNTVAVTTTVAGFDTPAYAVFSADSSTAYVMNCGPECGGTQASVQTLNLATLTPGTPLPVDGATVGFLSGSTLYVAGNSLVNSGCTGEITAATTCGRLDVINVGSLTVTSSNVITDGYHDRIDMSSNGQLFVGSYNCTTIGNVDNPQGEVRGCLSIYNTSNSAVVIPPDNGDVTGLQSFTSRDVEYVAEGGNLRVYDTLIDSLLLNDTIPTGTILVRGQVIDVKAVDFF
ncbi:MAG TPA: hypothetical protein VMI06_09140 [Terriglobia bacterium]|nr:hypothetical protein [Terriglobia bacterium]